MLTPDLAHPTTPRPPWRTRLRSAGGRRTLVAGLVATCVALVLLALVGLRTPLAFGLIGLLLVLDALLLYVTSRVAELPEAVVDERQEAVRNRAYRRSYRIVSHALIWPTAVVVLLAATGDPGGWLRALAGDTALVIALATSATQLVAFLPTMMLAWTEPDPREAD